MHPTMTVMLDHNAWATRVLIESCRDLSDEQFHQKFDIGVGSLHDTLRHVVGAMLRWADRIGERPLRTTIEDGPLLRVDALLALLHQADAELRALAESLERADGWNTTINFPNGVGGEFAFSKAAAIVHVLTHGAHHRAQAVHIRRRLGLAPLEFDLDAVEVELIRTGQLPVLVNPPGTAS